MRAVAVVVVVVVVVVVMSPRHADAVAVRGSMLVDGDGTPLHLHGVTHSSLASGDADPCGVRS
jgi:hypothetical protein